jgi:hypothetical protein
MQMIIILSQRNLVMVVVADPGIVEKMVLKRISKMERKAIKDLSKQKNQTWDMIKRNPLKALILTVKVLIESVAESHLEEGHPWNGDQIAGGE